MTFIDHTDLEQYLNIDVDPSWEAWADDLATSIQTSAETALGYPFDKSERTYFIDGRQRRVWLPEPGTVIDFISAVTLTVFNDVTGLYDPWLGTPPILRRDGSIDLLGSGYGPDAVQITYTAGWDADSFPPDLKQALIELVAAKWSLATAVSTTSSSGTDAPIKSITIGSLRQEFAIGTDSTSVTAKLQTQASAALDTIQTYKRVRVF